MLDYVTSLKVINTAFRSHAAQSLSQEFNETYH